MGWSGLNSWRRESRGGLGFAEPLPRRLGSPAPCDPAPEKQEIGPRPRLLRAAAWALFWFGENEKGAARTGHSAARPRQNLTPSASCLSKNKSSPIPSGSRPACPIRYGEACPHCPNTESFRVHDCRPRTFRLLVEGYVKIVRSGIWRWVCEECGRRFTDYPRLPCRTNAL